MENKLSIVVVDDHPLFRKGLISLIHQIEKSFVVEHEFGNGKELIDKYITVKDADVILLDVNMPVMDGFQTLQALNKLNNSIPIIALTMLDDDATLIKLLQAGVNGYLNKDIEPNDLKNAIFSVAQNGTYYSEYVAGKLVNTIVKAKNGESLTVKLNEQEVKFIELCCSDRTYQEIADIMFLSVKTIDGYRSKLFDKFLVKSRVGLVVFAIKNKIVSSSQL